jgi:NitT/TauT family transport system ATP-binding protein
VASVTAVNIHIRSKSFHRTDSGQKHAVIRQLEFSVRSGEFVCLVGPSGCGKTTLLHLIAGLDKKFDGNISFNEQDVHPLIGYVFQEPRLLPWRTVRDNIDLVLNPNRPHEDVDRLLENMGLGQVHDVYPERLSLGMSRRVALARAFAIQPDLLLMDEPFVSLDAPTARNVHALLSRVWHQRPHTVIFVTHDLREAIRLADRLIFLSNSPMRVVTDIPVDIPRTDRHLPDKIDAFRRQLATRYPKIRDLI